jgi:hypothetical protein
MEIYNNSQEIKKRLNEIDMMRIRPLSEISNPRIEEKFEAFARLALYEEEAVKLRKELRKYNNE